VAEGTAGEVVVAGAATSLERSGMRDRCPSAVDMLPSS